MRFFTSIGPEGNPEGRSVYNKLDQMIGDLFYHGVSPAEIKNMGWRELKYWSEWVKIIKEAQQQQGTIKPDNKVSDSADAYFGNFVWLYNHKPKP